MMMDDEVPMMTLDQLISHLQAIRDVHGGDALVLMCDDEPVVPPYFELRESYLGNAPPEGVVIITDRVTADEDD